MFGKARRPTDERAQSGLGRARGPMFGRARGPTDGRARSGLGMERDQTDERTQSGPELVLRLDASKLDPPRLVEQDEKRDGGGGVDEVEREA